MTAIAPEPAPSLNALVNAKYLVVPGLLHWLGRDKDFRESIESGLTETFEDFCARLSEGESRG